MRISSSLTLLALAFLQATPAVAFSKDVTITAVEFSADFDTATITLSKDPGEKVAVLYDLYVGDSKTSHAGGGAHSEGQVGQTWKATGLSYIFEPFGGIGTRFRLQFRVCPYNEPYTGWHRYEYCSQEFVTYVRYDPQGTPTITNVLVSADQNTLTVELSSPIQKGYIQYERYGSGNGYDYSSMQYRADNQKTVTLDIGNDFMTSGDHASGTSGRQTITLSPCEELETENESVMCGPEYPLTIILGELPWFSDIRDDHPNADAIRFVQKRGIVSGYPDGTFQSDNAINRAEFTKLITLSTFGQEMVSMCNTHIRFTDIPMDAWYRQYICRAQDDHLVSGYPDGTFRPAALINVAEAAKIIVLAEVNGKPNAVLPSANGGPWYEPYVLYLVQRRAVPISIDRLDENITRGEMAEILYRLREGITTKSSKTYDQFVFQDEENDTVQYQLLPSPQRFIKNDERNAVYRYAITAPQANDIVITRQTFSISGARWLGPQLAIFDDASWSNQIDTWASDDNWTIADTAILRGWLTIPAGQTRYVLLTVSIGTPGDMGFSVRVKHETLPEVILTDGLN